MSSLFNVSASLAEIASPSLATVTRREVEGAPECCARSLSVAEEEDHDACGVLNFFCERKTDRRREIRSQDQAGTENVAFRIVEQGVAPEALSGADLFPKNFRHDAFGVHAFSEQSGIPAVARDEKIFALQETRNRALAQFIADRGVQ